MTMYTYCYIIVIYVEEYLLTYTAYPCIEVK